MPLYKYECPKGHRFEMLRSMNERNSIIRCRQCHAIAKLRISSFSWYMGWKFLKDKSEKAPPAPNDSGYYPEWDEAYAP